MMTRLRNLIVVTVLVSAVLQVAAQEPVIRVSSPVGGAVWVGQRVVFAVEILVPGFFSGTPVFDLPSVPGMMLIPPEGSPVVGSETLEGISYTVQRHELSAFLQWQGEQTIPAFPVRLQFKRNPLDKEAVSVTLNTQPLKITARMPQGAEKLGSILSARGLNTTETWQPAEMKGPSKVGAAFTRTVTFTATDVPAMALPPFPQQEVAGLGVYRKAPEIEEHNSRGTLTSQRKEIITYVCKQPGHFEIPAVQLTWFDLDSEKLTTTTFPARSMDVAGLPPVISSEPHPAAGQQSHSVLLIICAAISLILVGWHFREAFRPVHLSQLNPLPSKGDGDAD